MLDPRFSYLFLDFETTGLDVVRDEPIQIGLLSIDTDGKTLQSFSSPVKPQKNSKELKAIVQYLTETSIDQLAHAPRLEDLRAQIMPFLTPETVLIGHNISFDLAFLQRYIDRKPRYTIDTFPLCKALIHFLPSYALEVVAKHLAPDHLYKAHDALSDCKLNASVFLHCIRQLHDLRHDYLILDYVIQQTVDSPLAEILRRTTKPYDFTKKQLFLPPLQKATASSKKIIQKESSVIQKAEKIAEITYRTGGAHISEILRAIDRKSHSWIICCSHKSKVQIIEQVLAEYNIPTNGGYDQQIFLPERIDRFLHQASFDEAEMLFVAKYLSHHHLAHTLMDINTSNDYKIFGALTTSKTTKKGQITLMTHEQRYEYGGPRDDETQVLYFDVDRRRQTLPNYLSKPLDPSHILQYLDHQHYATQLLGDEVLAEMIASIQTACTLFFGIMSAECDRLFVGYPEQTLNLEGIMDHTRMPMTGKSFLHLRDEISSLQLSPTLPVASRVEKMMQKLEHLLVGPLIVEKHMYSGDQRYYTLQEPAQFHTFDEFQDQLPVARHTFFSVLRSQDPRFLLSLERSKPLLQIGASCTTPAALIELVTKHTGNSYILTSSKSHAQDLFQKLIEMKYHERFLIVGENITGGVGKIVYLATNTTKPVIMIGGYACFLAARAKKFAVSTLFPYYCEGKQKELLLADCQLYG